MKNMRRKLLSLLLVMAMVCSMVPSALAAGDSKLAVSASPASIKVGETSTLSVTGQGSGKNYSFEWSTSGDAVTLPTTNNTSSSIKVTGVKAGTATVQVKITDNNASSKDTTDTSNTTTCTATVTVAAADKPTITLSPTSANISTNGYTQVTATLSNLVADKSYYVQWQSNSASNATVGTSTTNGGASVSTNVVSNTASVYVIGVSAATNVSITASLFETGSSGTALDTKTFTANVSADATNYLNTLSNTTVPLNGSATINAYISNTLTSPEAYDIVWTSSNTSAVTVGLTSNTANQTVTTDVTSQRISTVYCYAVGTAGTYSTITAELKGSNGQSYGTRTFTVTVGGTNTGYTLRLRPASGTSSFGTSVPVNYNYGNGSYWPWDGNDYYYNGYRTFGVVPVLYDANGREVTSASYTVSNASYYWTLKGISLGTSAGSTLYSTYSTSHTGKSSSTATIYARDVYNYSSSSTANLSCTLTADVTVGGTSLGRLTTSTSPSHHAYWTVYPGTYYHNTGSISASATVYANSTGYSLGSTDDAGGTSIVSELQSAVSSRYGYGSGWNSDRYYWDNSRSAWIDRTTGSIVSYDYNWNGWGNGWNNGYGYDTLRYVTFSSVSTTGGSLSASTGTRYHVGGRTSYGSSALENVVFTPNGKSSTASFNITAYGDYGTYSGTITFNMSGTATPTTLTMSGTAGQNLNFKTSDFTSWWKGMYPSGNLSYVRFTSCSAGSLTNGVNGSSVVGNSTSCYASASGSQVAIGNLIYNSNSTGAATVTVNFTGYGSTTSSSSASTNRAGTLTITLAAGTPSVVSNLNVSYSCGASGVNLNATTFYNAVSASVTTASYITLGSPSSGTLTQNGVNVTSGSRFVLSGTSNNIGDVLYKPAAGFNGTATIPFVAYNSSNQTVATGSISIAVTQAAAPTTPGKTFPDTANHWSNTYVSVLASAGIVGGYDDGKFHPEREMTYGEALKLILLAAGYPEQAQGSGTNWAVNYLTLAINNGILPGSASSYTLSATVDRNTIAAMTAKALKLSPVTDTSTSPFVDSKDPYVLALNKAGIIFGDSSSGAAYYQGEKAFNRGEAAAIIYRIYNYRA